jgi:hypothetical protein
MKNSSREAEEKLQARTKMVNNSCRDNCCSSLLNMHQCLKHQTDIASYSALVMNESLPFILEIKL